MKKLRFSIIPLLLCTSAAAAQVAGSSDPFLRYPDVCGSRVVFSFAGDLWLQEGEAEQARRLTSGPGPDYFAKFSPDCTQLAFTARSDGEDQVYVMPASGGEPRRLTAAPAHNPLAARWGSDNQVVGWSPDGTQVLFRSLRDSPMISQSNLYTVSAEGGVVEPVGMARAGMGVFSPDGAQLLYSPWSRDFRTWSHYRGGWAQDLWIFDRASSTARQLTSTDATERDPMWTRHGMFFLSDRNGRMNLFRHDPDTGEATQLTRHEDDAMWASADRDGNIVYEVLGRIWRYDPVTGQALQQEIRVASDDRHARPRFASVRDQIDSYAPAADGERALFVARGDVFLVGTGDGTVGTLTSSPDAHDRQAAMSADGRWVAFISDRGGEEELWVVPADGGEARQVTRGNRNRFSRPRWSPDGKWVAMSGKDGAIHLVDMASGAMREVGRSGSVFVGDHAWSPDSRYLVYTRFGPNDMGQLQILDVGTGKTFEGSDPMFNAMQPAFSPDGNYLYSLVEREFSSQFSGREWNFQIPRNRSVVVVPLRSGLPDPFLSDSGSQAPEPLEAIEFDGLLQRSVRAPVPGGDLAGLTVTGEDILYATAASAPGDHTFQISAYSFAKRETRVVEERVNAWSLAPWSSMAVVRKGRDFALVDASQGNSKPLAVSRLATTIEPRLEWRAVFDEVCRRYRDFFYEPGMHGHDWDAICARYRAELPRIGSRGDLTELIGRMVSELNVGHAYIDGRDELQADLPGSAALGASLTFDDASQRWRIARIYPGDPVDQHYRSPLGALGDQVREGDWLLSVDGRTLDARTDPFQALMGKAGVEVRLTFMRDGRRAPWSVIVKPVASQQGLVYRAWSERNREQVERLSGGRIGYVHIPAMSAQGLAEFARGYFSQIRKDGMIVDIRGNLGGSGSPLILDRLVRPFLTTGQIMGIDYPTTYPWGGFSQVFTGQLALLVNEATMSDGDTMAYGWRKAGLGPIYGTRTWGGTIGTGSTGPLLDGTTTNVPQFALAGTDGSWIVEGEGIAPDVEIGFDAAARLGGDDPQLAEAARLLQARISGHPGELPVGAPGPDKRAPAGVPQQGR